MPDENVVQAVQNAKGQKEAEVAPTSIPKKVADIPHRITILLQLLAPLLALVALCVAFKSCEISQRSMKVAQRAYLTYQVTVNNGNQVLEALRANQDFLLTYQVTVTNMGNTPADSILPKISVAPDPDRTPIMVTFPSEQPFDLGPKESRMLTGQALFKHLHNVRGLPGFATGFKGQIEYKDVFGDAQAKQLCYQFIVSGDSVSGGMCGTVMQILQIK
jgi:hypothetical protein